jgi:hypothetical protein
VSKAWNELDAASLKGLPLQGPVFTSPMPLAFLIMTFSSELPGAFFPFSFFHASDFELWVWKPICGNANRIGRNILQKLPFFSIITPAKMMKFLIHFPYACSVLVE